MSLIKAALWAIFLQNAMVNAKMAVLRFNGKSLVEARIDPIVSPGKPSPHVHAIFGGNAFQYTMNEKTPFESTCTSATISRDFSNYWVPKMYFQDPATQKLTDVKINYMNVYYFYDEDTKPFPPGLRMISGDPYKRSPPASGEMVTDPSKGEIQPVQITCPRANEGVPLYPAGSNGVNPPVGLPSNNKGAGAGFSDKECDGRNSPMRMDLFFPSCYKEGVPVDDQKNSMVWPTNDKCPAGTRKVPKLFYEIYWSTMDFHGKWTPGQGKSPWVLSNGDPTGYGMHGDFIAGWDEAALTWIIANCDRSPTKGEDGKLNFVDNGMMKCDGVPGGISTEPCTIKDPLGETISGTLDKLPGDNPIGTWGVDDPRRNNANATQPSGQVPGPPGSTTTKPPVGTGEPVPTTSGAAPTTSTKISNPPNTTKPPVVDDDDDDIVTMTTRVKVTRPWPSDKPACGSAKPSAKPSYSTPTTSISVPFFTFTATPTVTMTYTDMNLPCTCSDKSGPAGSGGPGNGSQPIVVTEIAWVTETATVTETASLAKRYDDAHLLEHIRRTELKHGIGHGHGLH